MDEQNATGTRTEGTTTARGARFAWTAEGDGPLVVWGHALLEDRWTLERSGAVDWSPVAAAGHRLLRLDWRGHGQSGGGAVPDDYTWSSMADDLLELLDRFGAEQPAGAIGNSMGTAAILYAAVRAPERFSHLVLTAPPTAWETRAAQSGMYEPLAALAESGGAAAIAREIAADPPAGVFAEGDSAVAEVRVADALLPSVIRGAGRSDLPAREAIRGLQIPTLILSWRDDPGHPVSTGEALHELIPGSRFEVAQSLADLGDWGRLVAAFLGRARS